jgi:hypothetical protein
VKWLVIRIAAGVILAALVVAVVIRSIPVRWDTNSVSVVWSKANEFMDVKNGELIYAGFTLDYALQNNTGHDITIPENVTIMKRLTNGGVLKAYSDGAKPFAATFLPEHQRGQLSILLKWSCGEWDVKTHKLLHDEDSEVCYARAFAGSHGLVLFDHANHLEITLPKPLFPKPKR